MKDILHQTGTCELSDTGLLIQWSDYVEANYERWKDGLTGDTYDKNALTDYVLATFNLAAARGLLPRSVHKIDIHGTPVFIADSYLKIVDQWKEFEPDMKEDLDRGKAIQLFSSYANDHRDARMRHERIFTGVLACLDSEEKYLVDTLLRNFDKEKPPISLVILPAPGEDEFIWENFLGLDQVKAFTALTTYYKIHEHGLVLGSKLYRDDDRDGRGHDFLAYLGKLVRQKKFNSFEEAMNAAGAGHEGSHGKTDKIIPALLNMDTNSPFTEGIAISLGRDVKDFSFRWGLNDRVVTDADLKQAVHDVNYRWAPAWFDGVFRNFQGGHPEKDEDGIWELVFTEMIKVASKFGPSCNEKLSDLSGKSLEIFIKKCVRAQSFIDALVQTNEHFLVHTLPKHPHWSDLGKAVMIGE